MDSSIPTTPNDAQMKRKPSEIIRNCTFAIILSLFSIFSLTYAFGFFAVLLSTFSISPSNFPSQCRIVSSSVDLRTSKICELGLLNYKAKRVFYPSERRKFRCRYDYYWASIFKVEFRDHFSGQTLLGLSEAPKEALPSDCRPNFAAAWSTKHTLKVHEDYPVLVIWSAENQEYRIWNNNWCCQWHLYCVNNHGLVCNFPKTRVLVPSACYNHLSFSYSSPVF